MRCRAGDLALVVGAMHPENIGRFVDVIRAHDFFDAAWWVRTCGAPGVNDFGLQPEGICFDEWLRPIRPQPDDAIDEISRKVPREVLTEVV